MIKRIINYLKEFLFLNRYKEMATPNPIYTTQPNCKYVVKNLNETYKGKHRKYIDHPLCIAFCKICKCRTKHVGLIKNNFLFSTDFKERKCLVCLNNKGRGGSLVSIKN